MKKRLFIIISVITVLATPITAFAKDGAYAGDSFEAQILKEVNAERESNGLKSLKQDTRLDEGADIRAGEAQTKWSHVRPDGTDYWTAEKSGTLIYGENLAKDCKTVNDAIEAWMESPAHRANILCRDYRTCAVGVIKTANDTYVIAFEFGY